MQTESVKLSIVIVNYNSVHLVTSCLDSILDGNQEIAAEIFVVDNHSCDNSAEIIRQHYPEVRLIVNDKNLGFARANNLALREAQGEYVLILNPDTLLPPGTLQTLLDFLDAHQEVGVLSPKLVKADGTMDWACRRSFPTSLDIYFRLLGIDRLFPKSKLFGHYNLTYLDPSISCEVDCVAGAFMLVRGKVMREVGLFDERFFMYAEDVDWCYRFNLAGWKVFYFADIEVLHYKGESAKQERSWMIREFYKAAYQCYEKYYAQSTPFLFNWLMKQALSAKKRQVLFAHSLKQAMEFIRKLVD